MKQNQELHAIAQDFIDEIGWLGTLREISMIVTDERIDNAIAILKKDLNIESVINRYGIELLIDSLLINAEAKNTSKPCPQAIKKVLSKQAKN